MITKLVGRGVENSSMRQTQRASKSPVRHEGISTRRHADKAGSGGEDSYLLNYDDTKRFRREFQGAPLEPRRMTTHRVKKFYTLICNNNHVIIM